MMVAAMLPASAQDLTNVDRETFLRNANIVSRKELSRGVTASSKAELNDGTLNHAAHIQVVDIAQSQFQGSRGVELNFRDSYKYNVAAYELSKLIGLNMIPPSVERRVAGHGAAVTWWVDRVAMVELDRQKRKLQAPGPDGLESPDAQRAGLRRTHPQHGSKSRQPRYHDRLADLDD